MTNEIKAPYCPISTSHYTLPTGTAPLRLPSIPTATDLPSLIRSVNIMRDILRTLTTSLTVNNFYGGQVVPAKQYGKKDYLMSDYFSDWYQTGIEPKDGVIYNKSGKTMDRKQKAYISRLDAVKFRNNARDNSQILEWRYPKKPDGEERGDPVFEEDFFERVVNVKWKKKKDDKPPPKDTPDYFTIVFEGVTYCGWRIQWVPFDQQQVLTAIVAGGRTNEGVAQLFKYGTGWGFDQGKTQGWAATGFTELNDEYGHIHPYPPLGVQVFTSVTGGVDSIDLSIICDQGGGHSASIKLGTVTATRNGAAVREYKSIGVSKVYTYVPFAYKFTWFITFEGRWVGQGDPFYIADPVKPPFGIVI